MSFYELLYDAFASYFLALSRTRWGLGMVPLVRIRRSENENYSRKSGCVATT